MSWTDKLRTRWNVGTTKQVFIILLVFACTGFTVYFLKKPLFNYLFDGGSRPLWFTILYYILILPVYNILLLLYGTVFGQFNFFWQFEKNFFSRLISIFRSKQTHTKK